MTQTFKATVGDSLWAVYEKNVGAMSIKTIFELDMVIAKPKIDEAVKGFLDKIPLLKCCLTKRNWRDCWVIAPPEKLEKMVVYHTLSEADIPQEVNGFLRMYQNELYHSLDVYQEPPIKFQFYQTEKRLLCIIILHHTIADGIGMLGLTKVFCEFLAKATGTGAVKTEIAKNRGLSNLVASIKIKDISKILKQMGIENELPAKQNQVGPITTLSIPPYSADARLMLSKIIIDKDDFHQIKNYVKKHNVTINDYLMAALIGLSRDLDHRVNSNSKLVGVATMINLRRYINDRKVMLANYNGAYSVLLDNNTAMDNFDDCVQTIHTQVTKAKNEFIGLGFYLIPAFMFAAASAAMVRKDALNWRDKFVKGWADRLFEMTNTGALDEYFEVFRGKVNYASFLGPFSKAALPLVSISTCNDILTLFLTQVVFDGEESQKQLDYISEKLRHNLLEWPNLA